MSSAPELALPSYRHILDTYFNQSDGRQILAHQIESFNQFMETDIPEIIHMANPISVKGSPEIPLAGPRSALATAMGLSTSAANALMGLPADGGAGANAGTGTGSNAGVAGTGSTAGANTGTAVANATTTTSTYTPQPRAPDNHE